MIGGRWSVVPAGWTRPLAAILAATLLAACGGGEGSRSPSPSPAGPIERPASSAELRILSPANGELVRGSTVGLRLRLTGATLVPQTSTELAPDEGHLHVLLDDELISMTEGLEQDLRGVSAGAHRLTVEFVASDHAPFDPRVVEVVAFEVRP